MNASTLLTPPLQAEEIRSITNNQTYHQILKAAETEYLTAEERLLSLSLHNCSINLIIEAIVTLREKRNTYRNLKNPREYVRRNTVTQSD